MNSANGLACLTAKELRAGIADPTYPMKVRLVREGDFAAASGSHSVKVTYWENVARDSQGYLWFSILGIGDKDGEIVRLDPENSHATNHAPKVSIRSIVANGQPLTSDRRLAPGTRTVSVQYFGVNLTAPNSVIYRYRLEGFDESWQEAGRRTEAVYTSLPPGTYSFAVMASSGDGIWTDPVSSAPITVLPRFYQTWWFAVAMVGLVMLNAGVAHRVRVRHLSRAMNARFDERLAERTRVARELHDTLLQTVHGSKLVADRALRDTADRDRLVRALEQLSVWLGQAAVEGRAALHSLRASTTGSNDLAEAFRRAIDECRTDSGTETPFSVQGRARELHPVVRDEVYRIGYEAIRNACQHSRARRIDVVLEYGHDLTLRISDNGEGIDAGVIETGKEGHYGLRGMRERAERIDAKFTLLSGRGTGTSITLVAPGRTAFR
jgi:signal transduction histidine kinase